MVQVHVAGWRHSTVGICAVVAALRRVLAMLAILSRGGDTGRMLRAHISGSVLTSSAVRANRTVNQSPTVGASRHVRHPHPCLPLRARVKTEVHSS